MSNKKQWNLTYFFKDEEAFLKALEDFKKIPETLASFKGKLNDEETLKKCFDEQKKLEVELSRLYFFASMRSDRDKKDVANGSDLMKVKMLFAVLGESFAYYEPEIIALGEKKMEDFFARNKEYEEFHFGIKKLFRGEKYVLSPDKELLLSAYSPLVGEPRDLYSTLAVADYVDPTITLPSGKEVTVTHANWSSLIESAESAEDRKAIFEALYANYDKHKNTFAEIYNASLHVQMASVKARGYKDILNLHLFHNAIDEGVFHSLIEVASSEEGSAPLKKYLEIKRKYLGLEKFRSYDRFLQLAKSKKKYTF